MSVVVLVNAVLCHAIDQVNASDLAEGVALSCEYDGDVCVAETIRNVCVNLGIDPDMEKGHITNVGVYRRGAGGHWKPWRYNPHASLRSCCHRGVLEVKIVKQLPS